MKKELRDRLKLYALSASAVAATASEADAQIVYVDLAPDDTVMAAPGTQAMYTLDLDQDGSIDFNMIAVSYGYSYSGTYGSFLYNIAGQAALGASNGFGQNSVLQSSSYAAVLNQGSQIGSSGSWSTYGTMAVRYSYFSYYSGYTSSSSSIYGNWQNQTNKYLGLKFQIGANVHYGWARISFVDFNEFIIHDYAYNSTPNAPIDAGDVGIVNSADDATNVVASDVADNENGLDLQVVFDAADETTISLYRAIVVKDVNAGSFSVQDAISTPANEAFNITPNGSPFYSITLNANSLDSDGDLITSNVPYRVFIQSVADGVNANYDTISAASNVVTLNAIVTANAPSNVVLADVADNSNGLDLEVAFDKIADETTISEYRVFIVKSTASNTFNLALAQSNNQYLSVSPNGQNIQTTLNANSNDVDGDAITIDTPYKAFVLAVADGTNAQADSLSNESNELTLLDITGIEDLDKNQIDISYQTDQIFVKLFDGNDLINAQLLDISGKVIQSFDGNNKSLTINRNTIARGVYILRVNEGQNEQTIKLIN